MAKNRQKACTWGVEMYKYKSGQNGQKAELHRRMRTDRSGTQIQSCQTEMQSRFGFGKTERYCIPLYRYVYCCFEPKKAHAFFWCCDQNFARMALLWKNCCYSVDIMYRVGKYLL